MPSRTGEGGQCVVAHPRSVASTVPGEACDDEPRRPQGRQTLTHELASHLDRCRGGASGDVVPALFECDRGPARPSAFHAVRSSHGLARAQRRCHRRLRISRPSGGPQAQRPRRAGNRSPPPTSSTSPIGRRLSAFFRRATPRPVFPPRAQVGRHRFHQSAPPISTSQPSDGNERIERRAVARWPNGPRRHRLLVSEDPPVPFREEFLWSGYPEGDERALPASRSGPCSCHARGQPGQFGQRSIFLIPPTSTDPATSSRIGVSM